MEPLTLKSISTNSFYSVFNCRLRVNIDREINNKTRTKSEYSFINGKKYYALVRDIFKYMFIHNSSYQCLQCNNRIRDLGIIFNYKYRKIKYSDY